MTQQPPPNDETPYTLTDSQIVWECPWYAIRQDHLALPNGLEYAYNVVHKCDAVWVLPVTTDGQVVLIRSYRPTLRAWCWEIPAGGIEDSQTPLQAAQNELREEVGGEAADWRFLLKVSTSNGLTNEYGHIFLATGVTLGIPHHEPIEFITIHPTPPERALAMARAGEINDAVSVMALLLVQDTLLNR